MQFTNRQFSVTTLGFISVAAIYCQLHGLINGSVKLSSLFESVLWGFYIFGGWLILNPLLSWSKKRSHYNLDLSWWSETMLTTSFGLIISLLLGHYFYSNFNLSLAIYQLLPIHLSIALVLKLTSLKSIPCINNQLDQSELGVRPEQPSKNQANNVVRKIKVLSGQGFAVIALDDISVITGARNYLELTTNQGNYLLRNTMTEFEDKYTTAGFVRIHRSNIININHVKEVITDNRGNSLVQLSNQQKIKLSNNYKSGFMKMSMPA